MTLTKFLMTLVLLTTIDFRETYGYGRMIYPLSRSSIWRKNFPAEINLEDGNVNCGGPIVQRENYNKCGECGDDYSLDRPRPNENGGTYGKGMIVRAYRKNSVINVTIQLSGSKQGQFEFDVCPLAKENQLETDECFHRNRLPLADGSGYIFNITSSQEQQELRIIDISLQLPYRLLCRHCVLRWQFRGVDNLDRRLPMMPSQSVTWRNCADIAILRGASMSPPPVARRNVLKSICARHRESENNKPLDKEI